MIILQPTIPLADPHICSDFKDRLNIFTAIFDTLVRRDLQGHFVPQIAKSWHLSADARRWSFTLRDDVVFHNGERLTAADVVANLQRACDPAVGGELGTEGVWASYIGDATYEIKGDDAFEMQLARPMADLFELLMAIPILPKSVLGQLPNTFIGSGPYELVRHSADEVELAPFAGCVTRQPSASEPLVFRAEPDEQARLAALAQGDAQIITKLSPEGSTDLGDMELSHESNLCVAFLINCSAGAGQIKPLRQALNYAVDVNRMIQQARNGAALPLNGPLTPLHFGCDPRVRPYPYDPEKARALVAEAKEAGFDGKLAIDIPMTLPDESPLLGRLITEDLAAVGIEVTLHHYDDRPAYAHMVKDKQIHDVCCFDSSPLSTYRVLREKINSDVAGPWWQGYDNSTVNGLLDQAAETVEDGARRDVYRQAYQLMHDDAPWIFLYRPLEFFGAASDAAEVQVSPEGILRFEEAD